MEKFEQQWNRIIEFFKKKFTDGGEPQMDTILFLIGVQELGMIQPKFSKDEKINLMHIAICKLLEPYGYYEFTHTDKEGWPHYKKMKTTTHKINKETLIKEAIIKYFEDNNLF